MNTQADKTQKEITKTVVKVPAEKKSNRESTFELVDNRPEIMARIKLQEMANNCHQVQQLKASQQFVNDTTQEIETVQGPAIPGTGSLNSSRELSSPWILNKHQNAQPPIQAIGSVKLRQKQLEAKAKHELLEKISRGIQNSNKYKKLDFLTGKENPNRRALMINMALRDHRAENTIKTLAGPEIDPGTLKLVIEELKSMPEVDPDNINEQAIATFAYYTKEGYENVTGIARGKKRWDRQKKADRDMTEKEIQKGEETLAKLKENWPSMPKYTGNIVYRVVHANKGIDGLKKGESVKKINPTSTSVSIDWSRLGEGKTACRILLEGGSKKTGAVDTRAVSTYTHEGEILLPPDTEFTKMQPDNEFAVFKAILPKAL